VTVHEINPLLDVRWPEFLKRSPCASVFHTQHWLEALKLTYRYEPVVYTTSPSTTELRNGWAFCKIQSWLTGRRAVSLPFSDHCTPLVEIPSELDLIRKKLQQDQERLTWKYVELRSPKPPCVALAGFEASETFLLHKLDLQPSLGELLQHTHKDSIQRKIRRAEREGLLCEEGRSDRLLDQFYRLMVHTRRRHHLPPQPREWFSNLIDCFGTELTVRVASRQGQPLASILTLRFRDTLTYKYGASDARFHNLGGIHLCLWRAIVEAKSLGMREFDLGRSDSDDNGLILFKDRWGAVRTTLTYFRSWLGSRRAMPVRARVLKGSRAVDCLPDGLLSTAGRLLYRHLG
jgi:hypothetical protein